MGKLVIRAAQNCRFDFVALGALVQRFDPGHIPLQEAMHFERHCSGAEYNAAANLAKCFRMRTAVVTANVHYPPGWWIESEVRRAGVTGIYKWFPFDGVRGPRMGDTWSDRGFGVRPPEVWYDRAEEAAALLTPEDFDWADIMTGTRWFHSGGIYASLSERTSKTIMKAMSVARDAGAVVSYDLNFRKKLWDASSRGAVEVNRSIAEVVDVLIGNEEDLQLGLGIPGPDLGSGKDSLDTAGFRSMIAKVEAEFPRISAVATTLRHVRSATRHTWKAILSYEGEFFESDECELDVYDRIGGGDGFAAGLIYGLLSGEAPRDALQLGWAHGALLATYPGDITMARLEQVRALAGGSGARVIR
jgi:2-dehydro-3-deoxygluconokinase